MRVLMLGWELPPRISGGLGTACAGIVQGLAAGGVEVLFVVPRAHGDEDQRFARVVAADRVPLEQAQHAPPRPLAAGSGPPSSPVTSRGLEPLEQRPSPQPTPPTDEELEQVLRLLHVDSPLRPYQGAAQYVEALERLTRRGARTALGTGPAPQVRRERAAAPRPATAPTATLAVPDGDAPEAQQQPLASCLALSGGYGPDLFSEVARYAQVVAALARRERFDVVHAHDWMTFPAGLAAARACGRPLVVHVHASEYDRSGERADTRIRAIEAAGLSRADRVVCVSRFTAGVLERHYGVDPGRVRVVHNAVEPRPPAAPSARRLPEPVVLFLGRVTFQKGPEYFLEAAARVLRVAPQVRFVVSGTGDLLPSVVERAAELGIAQRVRFTGFLEREEVERMFGLADVYVMPSVSEPFGIAPLEAMAQEVPVIVSRQSGVAEVLRSALKVDFWDVDELANKILALLRYPALRRALREDGRDELSAMTWESRGKRLRDVYQEVLA